MAVNAFLKIDNVLGESTDARHPREIPLVSFSWGLSRASSGGAGGAVGKVAVQDYHFAAASSIASPILASACVTGKRFPSARLSVTKGGEGQQEYYVLILSDVTVTSFLSGTTPLPTGGHGPLPGDAPVDQFTLVCATAEYQTYPFDAKGGRGGAVKATISVSGR